jgi:hypothetical protein
MSTASKEVPIHDDPIPMYAQLDIWAALHNPEDVNPAEYDAFRAEHGYADTWAELCAAVRTVARGAGYITVRTAEHTFAELDTLSDLIKISIISILESSGTGYSYSAEGDISFSVNGVVEIVDTRKVAEKYLNELRKVVSR